MWRVARAKNATRPSVARIGTLGSPISLQAQWYGTCNGTESAVQIEHFGADAGANDDRSLTRSAHRVE